jgi:hypothetical protein
MVPLLDIMHYAEIQVSTQFVSRIPVTGVFDKDLSVVGESHVIGTVHSTNTGHLYLCH